MSYGYHLVDKFDFSYGKELFSEGGRINGDTEMTIFLNKLSKFEVSYNITENLDYAWFHAVEIEVESFMSFYRKQIESGDAVDEFVEKELQALDEIKDLIVSNPPYVERLGYVFFAHI